MKIFRCWCSNPTGGKLFAINLPFTTKQYKNDNIENSSNPLRRRSLRVPSYCTTLWDSFNRDTYATVNLDWLRQPLLNLHKKFDWKCVHTFINTVDFHFAYHRIKDRMTYDTSKRAAVISYDTQYNYCARIKCLCNIWNAFVTKVLPTKQNIKGVKPEISTKSTATSKSIVLCGITQEEIISNAEYNQ